jgi:hypothetical protein
VNSLLTVSYTRAKILSSGIPLYAVRNLRNCMISSATTQEYEKCVIEVDLDRKEEISMPRELFHHQCCRNTKIYSFRLFHGDN